MVRLLLALLIAPGALPLGIFCFLSATGEKGMATLIAMVVAIVSYCVAVVVGLPVLIVLQTKGWLSAPHFVMSGFVLGLVGFAIVFGERGSSLLDAGWLPYAFACSCLGAVTAFLFWMIGIWRNIGLVSPNPSVRLKRSR
jgi:hypothetical protein